MHSPRRPAIHYLKRTRFVGCALAALAATNLPACSGSHPGTFHESTPAGRGLLQKNKRNIESVHRAPPLPDGYESTTADSKRTVLWSRIQSSQRDPGQGLPDFPRTDLLQFVTNVIHISALELLSGSEKARTAAEKLLVPSLQTKMDRLSDQAPEGYKKAIHAVGAVAKIRYKATGSHALSGLLGSRNTPGLLRLSLTSKPGDIAPGLALKLFIDGKPSQNISALVSLDGQGQNQNFFAHELSTITPFSLDTGKPPKVVSLLSSMIFGLVSKHPRKLSMKGFAESTPDGRTVPEGDQRYPYQVYFKPTASASSLFAADRNNAKILHDLVSVQPEKLAADGGVIYEVYAVVPQKNSPEVLAAELEELENEPVRYRKRAEKIGAIQLESPLVNSEYGDASLFFNHRRFEDE